MSQMSTEEQAIFQEKFLVMHETKTSGRLIVNRSWVFDVVFRKLQAQVTPVITPDTPPESELHQIVSHL